MAVNVYLSGNPVHDKVLAAFHEGINGDKAMRPVTAYEPSDIAVVFGVYKKAVPASFHRGAVIDQQRKRGGRGIVLETGYVNRGDDEDSHYAAGWGSINGWADFRNIGMPGDRWDKLGVKIRPWRHRGDYILLIGQVPWDASVQHIDMERWLTETAEEIARETSRPIIYRPHPKAGVPKHITGCRTSGRSLLGDLEASRAVVTFNSTTAIEAVIDGIPTFVLGDGSMAKQVANWSLDRMGRPDTPDREQWAFDLAYSQWTPAEMRSGETWRHLTAVGR